MKLRIAVVLFVLSSIAAAQKRPFTFEDMMALKRISDPVVSPDAKWVLFSAVDVSLVANTRTSHLWIVPITGDVDARQLTSGKGEDRGRFSPDGKYILYDAEDQIWFADFDAGAGQINKQRKVTAISTGASGGMWSPDGKNIVFISTVWPECNQAGDPAAQDACNKKNDDEKAASKVKASIFTRLLYRHWNAYTGMKRSHLFVQDVTGDLTLTEGPAGQRPVNWRDLTPGDHDVPPFSLGGQDDYSISPDGKELCFTSNIEEVEAISTNNDLFIVPMTGGTPKNITAQNHGSDSTPLYSPDGKSIAYRAQFRGGYESDRFRLIIYDRASSQTHNLTENFDQWVGSIAWTPDSRAIYFSSEKEGKSPIYRIPANRTLGGIVAPRPAAETDGHDDEPVLTAGGRTLVFTRMSVQAPNEVYALTPDPRSACHFSPSSTPPIAMPKDCHDRVNQITHLNKSVLDQVAMSPLEPFWFAGATAPKVEGFIVKPPNFDANKKWPLKFLIHGGPQGAWGDSWSFRWNPELFAANGYVVVMINPAGSTGYGQAFIDAVNGDWGGRPYQDLMLGLDYVEKQYPYIDKDRECALGASYGGYMANWILGHTTRFKCIVSHDGMFNTESAYGTTEELWFNEWEFKGTPWNNRELYRKWSPHLSVTNFKTPTLVIHGQLDYRLDVSEGFQLFTTLQRLKVPSKMLYFPDEGHWVLKPQNSQLWYQTVNGWVDQWVGGKQ